MAIITTITTDGVAVETRQSATELLSNLHITVKQSRFVDDTMKKLSGSLNGMIPSFKSKGNTGVAAKAAGMNP